MTRKERLREVYEYVRSHFPVHSQSDFAAALKYNRAYISSAMNGNEKNLTDKLFTNICECFPNTFNLDYLLNGNGDLLDAAEYSYNDRMSQSFPSILEERHPLPQWADNLIDIMSKQIKENEALNRELRQSIADVNALRTDLQKLIENLTPKS